MEIKISFTKCLILMINLINMKKEFSCELERLVSDALEKMTVLEREQFLERLLKIKNDIDFFLKRQKSLPNLKFD